MAGVGIEILFATPQQEEFEQLFRIALGGRARGKWPKGPLAFFQAGPVGDRQARVRIAAMELDEIRHRAIGMPAPEIVGVDLLNRPMKLSDFRGRVVVLSFWATSCGPCMKMIPHERDLADQFRDKPFAIVGVNCDDDPQLAVKAEKTQQIAWRSFRESAREGPSISEQWKITGLPTVYVIDQTGQIRYRWVGAPPEGTLSSAIDRLLTAVR